MKSDLENRPLETNRFHGQRRLAAPHFTDHKYAINLSMLMHVTIDPLWLWILLSHHVISCYCNVAITPQMVCPHELTQMNGTTHINNITTL